MKSTKMLHCFWDGMLIYNTVNKFESDLRKYCKIVSKTPDCSSNPESKDRYYSVKYNIAYPNKNAVKLYSFLKSNPYNLHHFRIL
jgi:hypothetical protein